MVNLVEITVRATDDTAAGFSAVRAKAAKAGDDAGKAFSTAFKLRADASVHTESGVSGGMFGEDKSFLNKLKSYASTPGGIGIIGTGSDTSLVSTLKHAIQTSAQQGGLGLLGGVGKGAGEINTSDIIKQVIEGNGPSNVSTSDMIKQVLTGNGPSNTSTKDFIDQIMGGNTPGNVNTEDMIRQVLTNNVTGNVSTKDFVQQVLSGSKPGNIDTTDTIHEKIDTSDADGKKDGAKYGSDFLSALTSSLGGGGEGESPISKILNSGGAAGGALPGIAGLSGMQATIVGLGGALVAVLPAITSVVAGLGTIGGGFAILEATNKKFAADMKSTMSGIEGVFAQAATPLAAPLERAASEIEGYFKQLEPVFQQIFGDSGQLVAPLVKGIEGLISGVLPGFLAMIKSGLPVFEAFASSLTELGKDLGIMFSDFASDGAGSASILKSIMSVIGSLLPFLGELGKIMVSALAPAVSAFSSAIQSVLPALTPLLSVLGSLAGATLGDLAGVLTSVGTLIKDLAPSFKTLSSVAAQLFTTLENTGVFAILGNVLEGLAGPLANLVNALVKGLAPALPQVIGLVSQWSGILATLAADGLTVVLNALTKVIQVLSPLLPLLTDAYVAFKTFGAVTTLLSGIPTVIEAVTGAVTAMTAAMDFDTIALKAMYLWDGLVAVATKAWAAAQVILNAILDLNPFVAIGAAVIVLAALIIKYHTQIWDEIQKVWGDVASFVSKTWSSIESTAMTVWNDILNFMKNWGQDFLALFGPIGFLAAVVINIIKYHTQIETFIKTTWNDILSFLTGLWGGIENAATTAWNGIKNLFETTLTTISGVFSSTWKAIENGVLNFATIALESFRDVISAFLSLVGTIINGAADAFGWVPGVGGKLQGAASAFNTMKNNVNGSFNSMISTVQGFQRNINGLTGKTVNVDVNGAGSGGVKVQGPTTSAYISLADYFDTKASGGLLAGFGGGDIVPTLLEPGEAVVDKNRTRMYASVLKAMGVPGFASGGLVGWEGSIGSAMGNDAVSPMKTGITAALTAIVKAVTVAQQGNPSGGPGGGNPSANYALAQSLYPEYKGTDVMADWNKVAMRESGWDNYIWNGGATGPTHSNPLNTAFGIAQALPYNKMPKAAWPTGYGGQANPTAQIEWMWDYMAEMYGGPIGAWNSEVTRGWYDNGGWLKPGWTMAYNGTGSPEAVGGGGNVTVQLEITGGSGEFDKFMSTWMKNYVRVKGGGNVQQALGRN